MLKRMTAVLAVAGVPLLALAAPASAAPGNGAERYGFENECTSEPLFEFCRTQRGVLNVTETPSGDFHLVDNGRVTFTSTDPDVTESGGTVYQLNLLLKEGEEHVVHVRSRFSSEASNGFSCSGSSRLMIVKGEVKRAVDDFSCDPVPEP